ncbi:MAG: ATP-dependent helicase [Candidatus Latescibacterota bacterium]
MSTFFNHRESALSHSVNLDLLNPPQREAVLHCAGPTLVLAGAGSGKTRVLTHKIAYLVSQGLKPWEILAVTFTNKAAREMASRVESLLAIPVQGLWIGTFHGICVRILRREADRWGFKRDFTIYDRDDQISMVKRALADLNIAKESLSPQRALGMIGKAKNDGLTPDMFEQVVEGRDAKLMAKVYRKYGELLRNAGAFDFDDLLLKPVEMFQQHPDSLGEWQERFAHILVDEYQDTNKTQYLLMKLLAAGHGNITVVGDDDQSIYSWRGANIQNILSFENDFRGVATVRLEDNYRSTSFILRAANEVVKNNKGRMVKELRTSRQGGAKVRLIEAWDDRDEADKVISSLSKERDALNLRLRDSVVLYRTNAQSRTFEDILRRRGIPYVIVGGIRFYERKEIKDVLSYFRLVANPMDPVSLVRAISVPKRGIGAKTVEAVEHYAAEKKITLLDALRQAGEYLSGGTMLRKVLDFSGTMDSLVELRGTVKMDQLAQAVVEKTGYLSWLEGEEPETIEDRRENLNELITALAEFENTTTEDDLTAFLNEVTLVSDVDAWDDDTDAVTLMTLHAAKGLEFPSVYIAGVENGLFPLPQTLENDADLEEERRLLYVGITRAEDYLHISYARQRLRYGSFSGGASMFIQEIPFDVLEYDKPQPKVDPHQAYPRRQPVRNVMEFEDYSQDVPEGDGGEFKVGDPVRSPTFGRGRITRITGTGESAILTIMFGVQEKKIVAKFGKLMKG